MSETLEYMTFLAVISLGGVVLLAVAIAMAAVQEGLAWLAKAAPQELHPVKDEKLPHASDDFKNSLPNTAAQTH